MYSVMHIRVFWHWMSPSTFELISSVSQPLMTEDQDEFFMILMGAIANHGSILDGPPDRRLLRHNADAFKVN